MRNCSKPSLQFAVAALLLAFADAFKPDACSIGVGVIIGYIARFVLDAVMFPFYLAQTSLHRNLDTTTTLTLAQQLYEFPCHSSNEGLALVVSAPLPRRILTISEHTSHAEVFEGGKISLPRTILAVSGDPDILLNYLTSRMTFLLSVWCNEDFLLEHNPPIVDILGGGYDQKNYDCSRIQQCARRLLSEHPTRSFEDWLLALQQTKLTSVFQKTEVPANYKFFFDKHRVRTKGKAGELQIDIHATFLEYVTSWRHMLASLQTKDVHGGGGKSLYTDVVIVSHDPALQCLATPDLLPRLHRLVPFLHVLSLSAQSDLSTEKAGPSLFQHAQLHIGFHSAGHALQAMHSSRFYSSGAFVSVVHGGGNHAHLSASSIFWVQTRPGCVSTDSSSENTAADEDSRACTNAFDTRPDLVLPLGVIEGDSHNLFHFTYVIELFNGPFLKLYKPERPLFPPTQFYTQLANRGKVTEKWFDLFAFDSLTFYDVLPVLKKSISKINSKLDFCNALASLQFAHAEDIFHLLNTVLESVLPTVVLKNRPVVMYPFRQEDGFLNGESSAWTRPRHYRLHEKNLAWLQLYLRHISPESYSIGNIFTQKKTGSSQVMPELLLTGGGHFNRLTNEFLRQNFSPLGLRVFVPSNPGDGGLVAGGFGFVQSAKLVASSCIRRSLPVVAPSKIHKFKKASVEMLDEHDKAFRLKKLAFPLAFGECLVSPDDGYILTSSMTPIAIREQVAKLTGLSWGMKRIVVIDQADAAYYLDTPLRCWLNWKGEQFCDDVSMFAPSFHANRMREFSAYTNFTEEESWQNMDDKPLVRLVNAACQGDEPIRLQLQEMRERQQQIKASRDNEDGVDEFVPPVIVRHRYNKKAADRSVVEKLCTPVSGVNAFSWRRVGYADTDHDD